PLKMNNFQRKNLALFTAAFLTSAAAMIVPAHAAGFYLQEQSVSAMGAAYAGAAAVGRDPSTIYYNPAGMTQLPGGQIHIGGNYLHPRANFDNNGSTLGGGAIAGTDSDDPIDATIIPNLYYSQQLNEMTWLGIGVSVPFGLSSEFDSTWIGRYDSIKSDLQTINIQPSVAFKVNDWLSIGGGMDVQLVNAELTSAVTNGVTEGRSKLEGDDYTIGWNIGVTLKPTSTTTIGLHHRSGINHTLDGRIVVTGVGANNTDQPGTANLDLPSISSIGIAQDVTERLTLLGQVTHFEWSSFQSITAILDVNGAIASAVPQAYSDTTNFSIGAEYDWNPNLTVRVGYQYDETPTNDTFRTTRTPDGDRNWFTGGATYDLNEKFTLDFSGAYIVLDDENVNVLRNNGVARVNVDRNDSWIGIAAVGLTYKF
ncbi:MAG: OmpP1/FadL family transporter, partial [Alphaproteobacteria bacterium]|nr:OmpP1/FadL family transporter [Alphaproteobacteria bacterium]